MQHPQIRGNYLYVGNVTHNIDEIGKSLNEQQHSLAEHLGWVRTIVRARLRDPHAVDDVMQEIAVACLVGQKQLRDPRKLAPWMYRVAVRKVMQYRRSIGRQRELQNRLGVTTEYDAVSGVGEVAENGADALDWLLRDERSSLVRDAVDRLPELDAQVLLLKYEHDYNYTQIAERLGISRSEVQSRLHRARRKMRTQLSRHGIAAPYG